MAASRGSLPGRKRLRSAASAALLLAVFFNPVGGLMYVQHQQLFSALLSGAAIIFVTGLLDGLTGLKPWQKLAGRHLERSRGAGFEARRSCLPSRTV